MKLQYVRPFIVLVAGLITLIINMKMQKDVTTSLLILFIVLIIFYVIGTLVTEIIEHSLNHNKIESDLEIITNEDKQQTEEVHVSFDDEETE